jgi:hypothetical protein
MAVKFRPAADLEMHMRSHRVAGIAHLSQQLTLTEYIAAAQQKRNGGVQNGFDVAVSAALQQQLAKKGIK